jgi:photosystem II stability/assembly factor-like uncharacterized protein
MRLKIFLFSLIITLSACNTPGTPTAPAVIKAPLVGSPSLQFLDMFNESDGWGVTETQIVRTNDGGITWYNVTPAGLTETGYSVGTTFLDVNHAWVQVPDVNNIPDASTLYRTTDGGLTWTFNAVQFSSGRMAFLNEQDGWVLADLGVGAGSNAVSVFITRNGGVTWNQMFTNDPNHPGATETLPLSGLKGGIVPLNVQTAWVGGLIYSPATVYLYRTDDSGVTWSQETLELPGDVGQSEVAVAEMKFVTEKDGFIALRLTGETYRTAFYVTHDAGENWAFLPTIIPGTGTTEFLSAQEIVFYNGQQFYLSRDAGQAWSKVAPDVVFGDFFASMTFANASTGWVVLSDPSNHRTLYKTTDGGATWLPLIP